MIAAVPLFLLSFRHRDALAAMVDRAGWAAIAARRPDGIARRFLASGASVAVIDAREALSEGLAAARSLADAVQTNGAAMLVIVSRRDAGAIAAAFEAGATHYLAAPFAEAELFQTLRFATRVAERLAGAHTAAAARTRTGEGALVWRWRPGDPHRVVLSHALASAIGRPVADAAIGRGAAVRLLGREGARAAIRTIARLGATGAGTPFAHDAAGGRMAHHVAAEAGMVVGRVERLAGAEGADAAARDPLTGLADGHGARGWIDARLAAAIGVAPPLVLVVVGLSRFDMVNAAFGRSVGDTIIRAVGRRIERVAHGGTGRLRMVARVAGSEFAIGLPAPATVAEGEMLATELIAATGRPFVAGDHVVTLAARIGIAAAQEGERDAAEVLRRASMALAHAAETERVHVLAPGEESRRAEDRRLELDLRLALDEDRIEIVWQPQVAVASGRIVGVEALARWRHPALGELGADTLFAAAERSDYLLELSTHVQAKAIGEAASWQGACAALRISLNLTAADIALPGFAEALLARINGAGLARERVTVELTEGELIEDLGAAATLLARLRAGGLRVAIDDFGTGYSSLAYLKALPLDIIKIDRRLAQDIAGSARDRIVVRSVIDMARSLDLTVIAEGVETDEQLALLAQAGCNQYQGFLRSAPVDVATLATLVAADAAQGQPTPPVSP